jgi:hypothetical protein
MDVRRVNTEVRLVGFTHCTVSHFHMYLKFVGKVTLSIIAEHLCNYAVWHK